MSQATQLYIGRLSVGALAGLLLALLCTLLLVGYVCNSAVRAQSSVDYDADDDGLIDVDSLARLNAIRWDLDGDGTADINTDATSYSAAFPNPMTSMGCPSDGCTGYEVTADLDFSGSTWSSGTGWTPIGDAIANAFNSTFDGGAPSYSISNLYINQPSSASAVGLFGYTAFGSVIRNVKLDSVDVTSVDYVGALVGQSNSQIENVLVNGTVDGRWYVGGLAALNDGPVTGSFSSAAVTSNSTGGVTGGLVGLNRSGITNSHSTGNVTGVGWAGGLVGWNQDAISGSSASGAVTASDQTSGGLVGYNDGASIQDSHAGGAVDGVNYVGGLVGSNSDSTIDRSTASGRVKATGSDVGGLAGWSDGVIRDSYASGTVTSGGDRVGGLVGENEVGGFIYDSRADGDVGDAMSTSSASGGLVGKNHRGIVGSVATGAVTSKGESTGGLVGWNRHRVEWAVATGAVSGSTRVGGLAGYSDKSGIIMGSSAGGTVTANGDRAGGLVGLNDGEIGGSFATGGVTGVNSVGGLVGDQGGTVKATYASGTVTGSGDGVGGLVGLSRKATTTHLASDTTASYAIGSVGGTGTNIGGFAGVAQKAADVDDASFTNNYWDTQTSGKSIGVASDDADGSGSIDGTETATAGVTGTTTTALQAPIDYSGIFADWNVTLTGRTAHASGPWDFGGFSDYPALRGPTTPPSFPSGTAALSSPEERAPGLTVGSPVSATDDDGDTLSYKLVGADAVHFSIDTETGQLRSKTYLDYEIPVDGNRDNTYEFMVQAHDGKVVAFRKVSVQITDATDNVLPPTITGNVSVDFSENGAGAVVTYSVNDPEGADTVWLPLEGPDRRRFEISASGALGFLEPPDHEGPRDSGGDNVYEVTIEATDGRFSDSLDVTITVTNVDEPPVIRGLNEIETEENFAHFNAGWAARDPENATTTFRWSLSGTDADDFDISITTGAVTFKSTPDHEDPTDADQNNVYLVTVEASDGTSSEVGTFAVMITVTGVDEPPVISGPDSDEVAENSTAVIGSYSATDPEGDQVGELQLSGADSGPFELSNGVLSLAEELNYEDPKDADERNTYVLTISALAGALRGSLEVTVTLTNVNEAPIIRGHNEMDFQERSTSRCVTRYSASDPEFDDTSWSIHSGADSADFRINSSGDLCFHDAPDFEAPHDADPDNVYEVTIGLFDGSFTTTLDVTITVTGVDEPPEIIGDHTLEFAEYTATTTVLQTYTATDPEGATTTFNWSLGGADSGDFELSDSGALTFKSVPDYETPADSGGDNEYNIEVMANDGSLTGTRYVTVTVSNVNEPPSIPTGEANITVEENATGNLTRYSATDPDEGDNVMWDVSGTDADSFRIDSSGNLAFDGVPDHETPGDLGGNNVYEISVDAKDASLTSSLDVTVTVTNVDEPPEITGVTTIDDYEENGTGDVATYSAVDPEGDGNITWSLAGADQGDFGITGGVLTFVRAPNYESPDDSGGNNQYEVTVQATDSNNKRAEVHVDVVVVNVDEEPVLTGPETVDDFPENSAVSRQVGRYTASDPEGATVAVTLAGTDSDEYTLAANGVLTFNNSPDYEEQASYSVIVRAQAGSHTVDKPVTVNIQNLEETGSVTLSAVQPQAGTELTATLDDDDGPSGTTWQWYRTSSRGGTGAAITNETFRSYTPGADDVGSYLRAVASYDDGHGAGKSANAVSANRVQVTTPGNVAPVFPADGDYDRSISENLPSGRNVGTPVRANDDNNDRLTYTIGDSDFFEIVDSTGQLRTKVALDHEDQATHTITVSAIDPSGLDDSVAVSVTVEDVDETPVVSGPTNPEVEENGSTNVATYTATDPDRKGIEWVLTGTDSDAFTLIGGVLTFNEVPDYEEEDRYRVTVEAQEQGDGTSVGRLSVTISVTNVDEPGALDTNVEEPRVGQTLRLSVEDEDGGESVREWKWERGDPNSPCGTVDSPTITTWETITGARGSSYTPTAADQGHCIRVTAFYDDRAGTGRTEQFLTPNSVEIGPFFDQEPPTFRIEENNAEGRDIGRVQARHSNSGETLTYTLGGADANHFTIDNNGQLKTSDTPLDYENQSGGEAVVEITAQDNNGQTATITVTIAVTDECTSAGEPPCAPGRPNVSSVSTSSLKVSWSTPGTPSGTSITGYELEYRDEDTGANWTPEIVAGLDRSHVIEDLTEGVIYEVRVRASNDLNGLGEWSDSGRGRPGFASPPPRPTPTDNGSGGGGGGGGFAALFAPVNVEPSFIEGVRTERAVPENAETGTDIGDPVTANDDDGDDLTYTLHGEDASAFTLQESTGQLRVKNALDFEAKASYSVEVFAADGNGGGDSIQVTVTVTDVNEPPMVDGPAVLEYAENGTDPVTSYTANDPEGREVTWSLAGDDAGVFSLSATATLAFDRPPDYETPDDADMDNRYTLTVQATDAGGALGTLNVEIVVSNDEGESIVRHYDSDRDGVIDREEVLAAAFDYFQDLITKEEVYEVIYTYFAVSGQLKAVDEALA